MRASSCARAASLRARIAMGNINFAASNRDLATTPLETMNAQLFLGAKIDVIVIAAIALIAMLTRGTESDANFIVAWLIVAFTAVDMVLLCLMTRPRRERGHGRPRERAAGRRGRPGGGPVGGSGS